MSRGVLLIGFGGPENIADVRPFLAQVAEGRAIPPERIEEVVKQYERIGGRSPYIDLTRDLARALENRLTEEGESLSVKFGMRNGTPALEETFKSFRREGITDLTAVVLAAYRSEASWNVYLRAAAKALHSAGARGFRLRYLQPWHAHPLFEEAVADQVRAAWDQIPQTEQESARWLYTAHSIPAEWDRASGYSGQIAGLAGRVAARLGRKDWELVYQSRSGRLRDDWLEPDVSAHMAALKDSGARRVFLIPAGFIMDHVEVLFDLDVKAREAAERAGLSFSRAKTVGTHPTFIRLLTEGIRREFGVAAHWPSAPAIRVGNAGTFKVAVIGGGLTGLAAAHRLGELSGEKGLPFETHVFEKSGRWGGVVSSRRREGFLLEEGADSFITDKPAALDLCRRLGLEKSLIATRPESRRSFVAKKGRLHPTPDGFYLLAPSRLLPFLGSPLLSWRGKARVLREFFIPSAANGKDESLASFVRRRFGGEALERLAQPMISGIYGADPENLSLRATFPKFLEMEKTHGGVLRGLMKKSPGAESASGPRYGLFLSLKNGMGSLIEALRARIPAEFLHERSEVRGLVPEGRGWRVAWGGGGGRFDAVILALPAPQAATLVRPWSPPMADILDAIPHGPAATLNVAIPRRHVRHALNGSGFVIPAVEGWAITGCTFSSVKFPARAPEGQVLLRAFLSAAWCGRTDRDIAERALTELDALLGFKAPPLWTQLALYPRSMPHYTLGHQDRVKKLRDLARNHGGLALAGNAYDGIGLPDCIRGGESAAEAAAALFAESPRAPQTVLS